MENYITRQAYDMKQAVGAKLLDEKALGVISDPTTEAWPYLIAGAALRASAIASYTAEPPFRSAFDVVVSQKSRPYTAKQPLDAMIVAFPQENEGRRHTPADFSENEFHEFMKTGAYTLRALAKIHEERYPDHGYEEVIALNVHVNPLETHLSNGRKLHAQTLAPIHTHVLINSEFDDSDARPLSRAEFEYWQGRRLFEPSMILSMTESILSIPSIREFLTNGYFDSTISRNGQLVIETGYKWLSNHKISDLIRMMHDRYSCLYDQISGLYVNSDESDGSGMPLLWTEGQDRKISDFIESLREHPVNQSDDAQRHIFMTKSKLRILGRRLRRGDEALTSSTCPVFLRSLAYTFLAIRDPKLERSKIIFIPRVMSNGNGMDALGRINEVSLGKPDHKWHETQADMQDKIKQAFST